MTKTVKRVVKHPKLFLRVEGKLQPIEVGTELDLTEKQCEELGDKVVDPKPKAKAEVKPKA